MIPYKYSLEDFDFVALSKQRRDPREKQRLPVLANLQDGERQADIADMLKISVPTVKRTPQRFKESGIDELSDRPRSVRLSSCRLRSTGWPSRNIFYNCNRSFPVVG